MRCGQSRYDMQPNRNLSSYLMHQAAGYRHGMVLKPQRAPLTPADVPGLVHMGVPQAVDEPWRSAAGGVARNTEDAELAAIGEAVERVTSVLVEVETKSRHQIPDDQRIDAEDFALYTVEQRQEIDFPHGRIYDENCPYIENYSLIDNQPMWLPQPFVTLQDPYGTGVPTSSGLAAGQAAGGALLGGLLEIIERDALMITWMHSLPGRAVPVPEYLAAEIDRLKGEVSVFDLTPAYSPFPVVAVMGGIKKRGNWRYSLGVACRTTWGAAVEKAYLEWNQGVLFAGIYDQFVDVNSLKDPQGLKSFDEHAMYYSVNPERWYGLPILATKDKINTQPAYPSPGKTTRQQLKTACSALKKAGLRVYYREITTIDALQAGLHVVKVSSPDMANIFAHQKWPMIHRVETMLESRYPDMKDMSNFPNVMPHPLG